jgi:hypothetical protein
MYRAVDCEAKLEAIVDHASCAVEQKTIMPWTASVEVDMIAVKMAASC